MHNSKPNKNFVFPGDTYTYKCTCERRSILSTLTPYPRGGADQFDLPQK